MAQIVPLWDVGVRGPSAVLVPVVHVTNVKSVLIISRSYTFPHLLHAILLFQQECGTSMCTLFRSSSHTQIRAPHHCWNKGKRYDVMIPGI